jgi:hypothetical protein
VPVLLFSSQTDSVTRQVYPAGQAATFPFSASNAPPFLEHIYTAPNFQEFVTHRLQLELVNGDRPDPDGEQTILRGFQRVPANSRELYRIDPVTVYHVPELGRPAPDAVWYRMRSTAVRTPPSCNGTRNPSQIVEVDAAIIPDHNRIFTPPFLEYVIRLVNTRAGDLTPPP